MSNNDRSSVKYAVDWAFIDFNNVVSQMQMQKVTHYKDMYHTLWVWIANFPCRNGQSVPFLNDWVIILLSVSK